MTKLLLTTNVTAVLVEGMIEYTVTIAGHRTSGLATFFIYCHRLTYDNWLHDLLGHYFYCYSNVTNVCSLFCHVREENLAGRV